jgi:hypothetical protein
MVASEEDYDELFSDEYDDDIVLALYEAEQPGYIPTQTQGRSQRRDRASGGSPDR